MGNVRNKLYISKEKGVDINPHMFGLFFEDINYGADGGLYAEMLENSNFEFLRVSGDFNDYTTTYDGGYGWSAYPNIIKDGDNSATLHLLTDQDFRKVNSHYLQFTGVEGQLGITNKAYDGIYFEKGKTYQISYYAKSDTYHGDILVNVQKGEHCYGQVHITDNISTDWRKYTALITATDTIRHGEFILALSEPGTLCLDFISLMPMDAICGLFRPDLVKLIKEIRPGFLRFPGGCIVEGNTLDNRYKWKESVGPREDRKANWNRWAVHGNNKENNYLGEYCHYNQSLGLGYYEYFLLCEYLEAKAIPILSVGLACQYQSREKVGIDSEEFREYLQDALDLIEFANGDETTVWGNLRITMGHKEPFYLEYIGIGNEQWETEDVDYFKRYEIFENILHERYPDIKIISSAGPNVKTTTYDAAWEWVLKKQQENSKFTAAIDEHYYVPPKWCYEHTDFYDSYSRDVKVFAGEYAAHIGNGFNRPEFNTMESALAEAAFMTGLERNADVVQLAAYAPLFARMGYTQWSPDLIWFDDHMSYGTPNYYVQKMYGNHMGTHTIQSHWEGMTDGIYLTVSFDQKTQEMIVKIVNAKATMETVSLVLDDSYTLDHQGKKITLKSEDLESYNSLENPKNIEPKESSINVDFKDFVLELNGYSFSIVRVRVNEI